MWDRYNSSAQSAMTQGRPGDAEAQFKMALAEAEKLGNFDGSIAIVCNNLANCLRVQGRFPEAEGYYKRAIEVKEKTVGPTHSDLVMILENYAKMLRTSGREKEADKIQQRAHAIFTKK